MITGICNLSLVTHLLCLYATVSWQSAFMQQATPPCMLKSEQEQPAQMQESKHMPRAAVAEILLLTHGSWVAGMGLDVLRVAAVLGGVLLQAWRR